MAIERSWESVGPIAFSANGGADGTVTLQSTAGFKVKQSVTISATALPDLKLEVKKVLSPTKLIVGPVVTTGKLLARQNLSAYTLAVNANIRAEEQKKSVLPIADIIQAVYRQEPGTTIGVEIDDQFGQPIDSIKDSKGVNRLAVDGQFTAEVDVQVDVDIDGYYDEAENPDPDNIGLIGHTRSEDTDQTDQVQRITAKRGTVDVDTVSQDVSLHDSDGNAFSPAKPLPVFSTYEKFIALISGSAWMKLGVYDEVIPSIAGPDLTLTYKEDGAILGTAVVSNYLSIDGWSVKLNRYIADDDGTVLLDDDGLTPLNLD